ncbi:zinc transporter, ZIP family [Aerococcus urinaehominis]|nr:zinc transporter, ZIP family [Aerococcus urinaehominis]
MNWFINLNPIWQASLAGVFTWACTAAGASLVYFFNTINKKLLAIMNGFAAGVMIAASFWSLLAPAISYAEANGYGRLAFLPAALGFMGGGIFLRLLDKVIPHLHLDQSRSQAEGMPSKLPSTTLLFLAITIHNIPEGLAVGVAFGAAGLGIEEASLSAALALALGIGLQNFPEGAALSMPIRAHGASQSRALIWDNYLPWLKFSALF